ncbi:MAG: TIGR02147 family protein, partial [Proteobacteria bacterium]
LTDRQRNNPAYSLRAFARFLGIQAPTLASVINGKRVLPQHYCDLFAKKLLLSPKEKTQFLKSVQNQRPQKGAAETEYESIHLLNENAAFKVIAEWEHYAILSLIDTRDFESSTEHIASRLGVTNQRASICLQNLEAAGLIKVSANGEICKMHADVKTTEDTASVALQISHKESLELGLKKLESISVADRDYSSSTFAMPLSRMPDAKKLIRKFRREFTKLFDDHNGEDVFQINIQLYPLTNLKERK